MQMNPGKDKVDKMFHRNRRPSNADTLTTLNERKAGFQKLESLLTS